MTFPRVCLIGAGSSGIAAAKALAERASKRHTIQVDYDDYLYELATERRAGGVRARARGYAPPALCRPSAVTTAS